ncbi:S41 family peptidase [Actinomadura kijaniata]|uniref:S41 family peptidase n=1 Tax=Actinomadura kijaniata TaxID=46161 RepID=UPI000A4C64F0|nr:S41 family peptidase [Actinomadura kijaniata]
MPNEYLAHVLDLLEEQSLRRKHVDWTALRAEALARTEGASSPAEVYGEIQRAVRALGDPHTFFLTPEAVREAFGDGEGGEGGGAASGTMPTGKIVEGRFALVALPESSGDEAEDERYVGTGVALLRELDAARPAGWIVDLRGNTGGGMYAPLTVLAPLLGEGRIGAFVNADGEEEGVWSQRDGRIFVDDETLPIPANPLALADPDAPVAVLTDGDTMSAAEAVVIALRGRPGTRTFGAPTGGVPTGNVAIDLADGAMLVLTVAREADRTGHAYPAAPIEPDEPAEDALAAAVVWLSSLR